MIKYYYLYIIIINSHKIIFKVNLILNYISQNMNFILIYYRQKNICLYELKYFLERLNISLKVGQLYSYFRECKYFMKKELIFYLK